MRIDSHPVVITINLPPLADEAVVEIHDFLFQVRVDNNHYFVRPTHGRYLLRTATRWLRAPGVGQGGNSVRYLYQHKCTG